MDLRLYHIESICKALDRGDKVRDTELEVVELYANDKMQEIKDLIFEEKIFALGRASIIKSLQGVFMEKMRASDSTKKANWEKAVMLLKDKKDDIENLVLDIGIEKGILRWYALEEDSTSISSLFLGLEVADEVKEIVTEVVEDLLSQEEKELPIKDYSKGELVVKTYNVSQEWHLGRVRSIRLITLFVLLEDLRATVRAMRLKLIGADEELCYVIGRDSVVLAIRRAIEKLEESIEGMREQVDLLKNLELVIRNRKEEVRAVRYSVVEREGKIGIFMDKGEIEWLESLLAGFKVRGLLICMIESEIERMAYKREIEKHLGEE